MALEETIPSPARRASTPEFDTADLVWEQVEEAAVRAYRAGGAGMAFCHWQRGLAVARARFAPSDPRLGTSLVNYAFALRRRDEVFLARRHFALAAEVFADDWRWVGQMHPAGAPAKRYDRAALCSIARLVQDLHRRSRELEARDEVPVGRLERWHDERPARGSHLRKLMGASLLLVSRPDSA